MQMLETAAITSSFNDRLATILIWQICISGNITRISDHKTLSNTNQTHGLAQNITAYQYHTKISIKKLWASIAFHSMPTWKGCTTLFDFFFSLSSNNCCISSRMETSFSRYILLSSLFSWGTHNINPLAYAFIWLYVPNYSEASDRKRAFFINVLCTVHPSTCLRPNLSFWQYSKIARTILSVFFFHPSKRFDMEVERTSSTDKRSRPQKSIHFSRDFQMEKCSGHYLSHYCHPVLVANTRNTRKTRCHRPWPAKRNMLLPVTTAPEEEFKPKPPNTSLLTHAFKICSYLLLVCICFSGLVVTVLYLLDVFIETEGKY